MTTLSDRLQQADVSTLSNAAAAAALNTPDPDLPKVLIPISGRVLAEIPTWTIELAAVRVVLSTGIVPASIHPSGSATALTFEEKLLITTLLEAVDKELVLDLSVEVPTGFPTPLSRLTALLDVVQSLGLLSAASRALIMQRTRRDQSWAEQHGIEVTELTVAQARGTPLFVTQGD